MEKTLKNEIMSYVKKERQEGVKNIGVNKEGLYYIELNDGWVTNDGNTSLLGKNIRRLVKSFHRVGEPAQVTKVKTPKVAKKVKEPKSTGVKALKEKVTKPSKKSKVIEDFNKGLEKAMKSPKTLDKLEQALNEAHDAYKQASPKSPEYKELRNKYLDLAKQYEEAHKQSLKA